MFYPGNDVECRAQAQGYLKPAADAGGKPWIGGIVPHAGWICSGAIAGQTIATLAAQGPVDVVVIFGAVHTPLPQQGAALDSFGRWSLPCGDSRPDVELRAQLAEQREFFGVDDRFHMREHAIEVELPLVQLAWPGAAIVPIEVPAAGSAVAIGRQTAAVVSKMGKKVMYLASTDLTHYGVNYGFTPAGLGLAALEWAKDNDRRLLRLIASLSAEQVVGEATSRCSACGAGAIAALLGACRELGASEGRVLTHATSYETLKQVAPQSPDNAVGYAGIVVG